MIYDSQWIIGRRAGRDESIRAQANVFWMPLEQQVQWGQEHEQQNADREACGPPSRRFDEPSEPRQDGDRADPDAGEGDAQRKPAPADKPVGQVQRLPRIGEAVYAATGKRTQRQLKLPGRADYARQDQACAHRDDTQLDHYPRPP
jgi:hypothetical protein